METRRIASRRRTGSHLDYTLKTLNITCILYIHENMAYVKLVTLVERHMLITFKDI